jgi:solute carrier family 38 (sodium-coupled neutral amino acid transporter), member 9
MFEYTNIPAWILRLAIFCCLFSTYPLVNHFLKTILKNLFWKKQQVSKVAEIVLNVILAAIPLLFALFYPNIGTLLSYVGSVSGFMLIYLLPVLVHLKQMKLRI